MKNIQNLAALANNRTVLVLLLAQIQWKRQEDWFVISLAGSQKGNGNCYK